MAISRPRDLVVGVEVAHSSLKGCWIAGAGRSAAVIAIAQGSRGARTSLPRELAAIKRGIGALPTVVVGRTAVDLGDHYFV